MLILTEQRPGATSSLEFSKIWQVLGPFQIGTREATWGSDPLELHGGFSSLEPGENLFSSSLAPLGQVSWSERQADVQVGKAPYKGIEAEEKSYTTAKLSLSFPDVDWNLLQLVYGWSALQWQAWIRGTLIVQGDQALTIELSLPGILEFEIDGDRHFGGDYFAFARVPLVKALNPGSHMLNVRVVRDVRAMGAVGQPIVDLSFLAHQVSPSLHVLAGEAVFPDVVSDRGYAGNVCSIPVQNTGHLWLEVLGIVVEDPFNETEDSILLNQSSYSVAPGQFRTIGARLVPNLLKGRAVIRFSLIWRIRDSNERKWSNSYALRGKLRQVLEPQRMVFKQRNGSTSYAIIQPPRLSETELSEQNLQIPVLIVLHGAGVEAESLQTREMLHSMGAIRAWVIVPSGGSQWGADDWHTWGLGDVEAAVSAIPQYATSANWEGPGVDIHSLYVVGHSNGAQGTWHFLTHMPDRICAAAPVSGYASIQKYVPYEFAREIDPRMSSIIQGSLSSYRHELLVQNAKGIRIQLQHGSSDDNVPTFHSRRMLQLLRESGSDVEYYEIPGKGHWYPGIMATIPLLHFYKQICQRRKGETNLPTQFTIINPGTGEILGSRGGIIIEQLRSLGQLGHLDIHRMFESLWNIKTSNIRRLRFGCSDYTGVYPTSINIDDILLNVGNASSEAPVWLYLDNQYQWKISTESSWKDSTERSGPQFGSINAILRTKNEIEIRYHSESTFKIALQVSRNLYQYYSVSCTIVDNSFGIGTEGNVIHIVEGVSESLPSGSTIVDQPSYPIQICPRGVQVRDVMGRERLYHHRTGIGAIYLVPRTEERLHLVVWGYDKKGLQQAARLTPGLTGVGQPDFAVLGPECSWKGAGGVLAMGFFDYDWSISSSSYIS